LANCKKIWGADKDFDLNIDYEEGFDKDCACSVREDHGLSFGPWLTMTNWCSGPDAAWNELDRMLGLWARQVESGRPMTREERLDIFSGPSGEYREFLGRFMDRMAEAEANSPDKAKALGEANAVGEANGMDASKIKEVLAMFKSPAGRTGGKQEA
jgi:hypothetical protein